MSEKRVNARLKIRRDVFQRWEQFNPVLLKGEAAYVTDLNELRIGDGVNRFTDLPALTGNYNIDLHINNADIHFTFEEVEEIVNTKIGKSDTIDLGFFF